MYLGLPHSGTKKRWQNIISCSSKDWIVRARIIRSRRVLLPPLGSTLARCRLSLSSPLSNLELGGAMARKSASVLINTCDRNIFGVTNNKIHDTRRLSGVPNHWWVKSCVISLANIVWWPDYLLWFLFISNAQINFISVKMSLQGIFVLKVQRITFKIFRKQFIFSK